jgi:tRNA (guanine9-N1)-methyltransferase
LSIYRTWTDRLEILLLAQFKGHEQSYLELFRKESLVYLTADSPHTITELCRDKVYIIGGIVDRNRHKGITYKKAQEQGIATAKLPLDSCVQMGAATRVLTVNHGEFWHA